MAAATDLKFNVSALDKASTAFIRMAKKVENLSDKLEELDRKKAEPEVNVNVDRGLANIQRFGEQSSGIMSGAMKIISANALLMGGVLAAALLALPVTSAIAATGMVLAFSGAFAAIGLFFAAKNKGIKKEFTELRKHVVSELKEISAPFQDTLRTIADVARETFDTFSPHLAKAFEQMAPAISEFVEHFGEAFEKLIPAIEPMTDAFKVILDELGPALIPLFENIGEALADLADTVGDNPELFVALFVGVLEIIPGVIKLIDTFAEAFVSGVHTVTGSVGSGILALASFLTAMKSWVDQSLNGVATVLRAFSMMPGPIGNAAEKGLGKLREFRQGADRQFDGAIHKLQDWGRSLKNAPKKVELKGNIRDLKEKLADAKRRLRRAPKEKKTKIKGDISQLRDKLRQARQALNNLEDENVNITTTLTTINREVFRRGGMKIRARGGPVDRGDIALVGEEGPEIVQFGASGNVVPANKTAAMMRRGGGAALGGGAVVIEVRSGGSKMDDLLVEVLRRSIRVKGGNVQTVLGAA